MEQAHEGMGLLDLRARRRLVDREARRHLALLPKPTKRRMNLSKTNPR